MSAPEPSEQAPPDPTPPAGPSEPAPDSLASEPGPASQPAEPLPQALRRAGRRAVGMLAMAALVMGALALDGHSVLPGLIPLASAALCLLPLAAAARPSPQGRGPVLVQLLILGTLAVICGLAVVAQYHYGSAITSGSSLGEASRLTLDQLRYLVTAHFNRGDLAFLLAVSTAAATATYAFAPGQRHLRALAIVPLPGLALILFTVPLLYRDEGAQISDPSLLIYPLGVLTLSIAWSLVFLVAERFGPDQTARQGSERSED